MKKLLTLMFFVFVVYVTISGIKYLRGDSPSNYFNIKNEEKIFREEIAPSFLSKEDKKDNINEAVIYVPYYWKNGVDPTGEREYLKGYIPNISNFKKYYSNSNNYLLFMNEKNNLNISSVLKNIKYSNILFTEGMLNSSEYFSWDSQNCITERTSEFNLPLFSCPRWINWLEQDLGVRSFTLTKCSVNRTEGFCVFADYLHVYFESKMAKESRCFNAEKSEYLCDYDEYINIVKKDLI